MEPKKVLSVLLISKKTEQAAILKANLEKNPNYEVKFEESAESAMGHITKADIDCVVFNFQSFGLSQLKLIEGIKSISNIYQILIFADHVDEPCVERVRGIEKVILIEKPILNLQKDVSGLCERLIGGENIIQRRHKRHPTEQTVGITVDGRLVAGKLIDLSESGACVDVPVSDVKTGKKIVLTIDMSQAGRKRVVYGEVRWAKCTPGKSVVGILFSRHDENQDF